MGIDRNTYTVCLRKTLNRVVVQSYRRKGSSKRLGVSHIPYRLAEYLALMPNRGNLDFSNQLYDFTHKDFDSIGSTVEAKVTRRGPLLFVTIDLSKV
jgi:hypothetical protein